MSSLYRSLNLRHYRLVQAIAETGQLSAAADRLAITQPAASRTLREIETALGAPIFERHPRGMVPTPAGEIFVSHAASFVSGLAHAEEEFRAFGEGQTGAVRIGAVTGAAVGFVIPAIQELAIERAEMSVDVAPSAQLMEGMLAGEYDFVLCRIPTGTNVRNFEILGGRVEVLKFLVRPGHPVLKRKNPTIRDLADLTWVTQASGMPIRDTIEQAFLAENVSPPANFIDTPSFLFMTAYLRTSDAITAVASEVADLLDARHGGGLQALPMRPNLVMTPYHLMRDRTRRINPLAERLLALVARRLAAAGG